MNDTEYNGWTNRETWIVNLWHSETFRDWVEQWREHMDIDEQEATPVYEVGDMLKENFLDLFGDASPEYGVMADLLSGSIARINWTETAELCLDGV